MAQIKMQKSLYSLRKVYSRLKRLVEDTTRCAIVNILEGKLIGDSKYLHSSMELANTRIGEVNREFI
ncbi:hypothetical protein QQG55_42685 [Brugia pahangi]